VDAIWALAPFLLFLACPLMMVACMFGMRKMGTEAPPAEAQAESRFPEERVAALQQQLQAIQAELATLQPAPAPSPALAPVSNTDRIVAAVSGTAHAPQRPA
jgi:hypothetical protein